MTMTWADQEPSVTAVPCVVTAWTDGASRRAGPLTGYRLFDADAASRVPVPGATPVVQVHVPESVEGGHDELVRLLDRAQLDHRASRLAGLGVAATLVASNGREMWSPPSAGPVSVRRPGAPGTVSPSIGIVIELGSVGALHATWRLLDDHGDDLYGQQVLDRSAHLPPGAVGPPDTRRVGELHLCDSGRRLVHLHRRVIDGDPTAWVAARPGHFDLFDWMTWGDRATGDVVEHPRGSRSTGTA